MEDESRSVPRALSVEMMDERPWPASRLEELVFKRGVSGKIDIIISRARILSLHLSLSLLEIEIVLLTFVKSERNAFYRSVLIDYQGNDLFQADRFIRDINGRQHRSCRLRFNCLAHLKNIPSSFSLSSSRSSDRLSSSSSSSWERCDAPASLPDCSPTLPLPAVFERFRTGLWPLEEPENTQTLRQNQLKMQFVSYQICKSISIQYVHDVYQSRIDITMYPLGTITFRWKAASIFSRERSVTKNEKRVHRPNWQVDGFYLPPRIPRLDENKRTIHTPNLPRSPTYPDATTSFSFRIPFSFGFGRLSALARVFDILVF